jgi:hypothetical protein
MEEHTLKISENKFLRREFGPVREKVAGRTNICNEELQIVLFTKCY